MAKLIVGIDFGTSTTVVRYSLEGSGVIYPVKDANGTSDIIPSCIFKYDDQDATTFGHQALACVEDDFEGRFITNFKMGLLEQDEERLQQSRQYIKEFMHYIYELFASQTLGITHDGLKVYVSHPAKWSSDNIKFMKQAVSEAGFVGEISACNEPRAATFEMLTNHLSEWQNSKLLTADKPINVFMLDMGAGTSDIVIFELSIDKDNNIEIQKMLKYPSGDCPLLCGGREIDDLLRTHLIAQVKEISGHDLSHIIDLPDCKRWKDQHLSNTLKNNVVAPCPPFAIKIVKAAVGDKDRANQIINSITMGRTDFETLSKNHWSYLYQLITEAMAKYKEEYGVGPEDIDALFLTGGHARWYTVPNLFNGQGVCGTIGCDYQSSDGDVKALNFEKLRNEPWRMFMGALPHETVARGLCLQDENIKIFETSANSIWAKLTINDKSTDLVQVTRAGEDIIPLSNEISQKVILNKNMVWEDLQFDIKFDLYIGEDIDTAEHKVLKFSKNDNDFWSRIFLAVFIIPMIVGVDYVFELKSQIEVTEGSEINISGDLFMDGQKKEHFTDKDLK